MKIFWIYVALSVVLMKINVHEDGEYVPVFTDATYLVFILSISIYDWLCVYMWCVIEISLSVFEPQGVVKIFVCCFVDPKKSG